MYFIYVDEIMSYDTIQQKHVKYFCDVVVFVTDKVWIFHSDLFYIFHYKNYIKIYLYLANETKRHIWQFFTT